MGMFTRLTFRNPFQVARAAISSLKFSGYENPSRFIPFVVHPEVQAGAEKVDLVLANLIAQ